VTPRHRLCQGRWLIVLWAAVTIASTVAAAPTSAPRIGARPIRESQPPMAAISAAIRDRLTSGFHRRIAGRELNRLYDDALPAPLWVDSVGRPGRAASEALALLGGAAGEGLEPGDYDAAGLERQAANLETARLHPAEDVAAFDVALSAALLRYFRHLHLGRVDPRTIGFRVRMPDDTHDFVPLLRSAIAGDRVATVAADLAPALVQYRALRAALARYRAAGSGRIPILPSMTATVHPGESYPHLATLTEQLRALGDLPAELPPPAGAAVYDGDLVTAVERFQLRHGLAPDGILGRATQAALRVPIAWRIRQIELALERLRWLPDLGRQRFIVLNIPMFTLWAWDSIPPTGAPSFGMRAIVGRAHDTRTPVFVDEMQHVVFRPYWNVPPSILRNEILPVLARDPGYLRRNGMEMVRGQGDDAPVEADTVQNHALLRRGVLRLRQRPGARNSLGLVKFVFPNDDNVYMHGTPAQALFGHSRRDFSHGCVRVEDPAALAAWVLKQQPGWTQERVLAAMSGATPQRVDLIDPIQVILFYVTAVVMPEDGTTHFAEDIYGHDLRLDRALTIGATVRDGSGGTGR
jgi:murein L,D-transpeptidase YcbB/YkuD